MNRKKSLLMILVSIVFFALLSSFGACAEAHPELPAEYETALSALPDDVRDALPDEMLRSETVGQTLESVITPKYIFSVLSGMLDGGISSAATLLLALAGLLILSSLIRAVIDATESGALSGTFRVCSSVAIFAVIIGTETAHLERSVEALGNLNSLMEGMIPISGIIWATGGNIGTASASGATFYAFLAFCERLCVKAVTPVCLLLTATSLCSAISSDIKLGGVSSAVKKTYNFTVSLVMSLLVAILGIQTTLTSASDGLGAKAAKLVSSTFIPVVGGSVGETLRSVAGSVEYVKSVFGISVIIFIIFMIAPTLITVLLTRGVFLIAGGVADMLGCDRESKLLGEMGHIYGCMTGALAMSSVMFILGFAVFVKSTVAIS